LAVWHAIENDRAQRAILEAAAKEARNLREYETELRKKLYEEIRWINGQANIIEDKRDDALHSPLWARGKEVIPLSGPGHTRRAKKLIEAEAKRGLLVEFLWCRDASLILTDYVKGIEDHLTGPRKNHGLKDHPRRIAARPKKRRSPAKNSNGRVRLRLNHLRGDFTGQATGFNAAILNASRQTPSFPVNK
jgi:hypothetical protein